MNWEKKWGEEDIRMNWRIKLEEGRYTNELEDIPMNWEKKKLRMGDIRMNWEGLAPLRWGATGGLDPKLHMK